MELKQEGMYVFMCRAPNPWPRIAARRGAMDKSISSLWLRRREGTMGRCSRDGDGGCHAEERRDGAMLRLCPRESKSHVNRLMPSSRGVACALLVRLPVV